MNFKNIIKENYGTIIDVRTPVEFRSGHVPGSINIPLQELPHRLPEIKELKQPLVLCCASGTRSGVATQILMKHGIECLNGGSWSEVQYEQSQKATG